MRIASFDIFDTCLVRACGAPERIWEIVAREIKGNRISEVDVYNFVRARRNAEAHARLVSEKREISIYDIYRNIDTDSLLSVSYRKCMDTEIEIEEKNLVEVYGIGQKIEAYRRKGYQIMFISDMYLPAEKIEGILRERHLMFDEDRLFVSSKENETKESGGLYLKIMDEFKGKIEEWIHHGDNIRSDVKIPARFGIRTVHVSHCYSDIESFISDNRFVYTGPIRRLADICKAVRLSLPGSSADNFATDYIAVLFVPFVYDLLNRSRQHGVKKLFFIARDGRILYEIALLLSELFPDISLRYIYMSRSSLYFPALESSEEISSIVDWKRVSGMKPADVIKNYTGLEIPESTEGDLRSVLESVEVKRLLAEHHRVECDKLMRYFVQEGLADYGNDIAIVDLRGTGKSHRLINHMLCRYGYMPVRAYYLEMVEKRVPQTEGGRYDALYTGECNIGSDRIVNTAASLLESYYAIADHPRTIGYVEDSSGVVKPVFEHEPSLALNRELFDSNLAALSRWTMCYISTKAYLYNELNIIVGISLLKRVMSSPDLDLVKILSKIEVSDSGIEKIPYVRRLTAREILSRRILHGNLTWFTGSWYYTFGKLTPYVDCIFAMVSSVRHLFRK